MKIRILGNSIRFRLKQSEVQRFQQEGSIAEATAFGPAAADRLAFVLQATAGHTFHISYQSGAITVLVPQGVATGWTQSDAVGFEETIDTGKGETIKILVEKDFKCLDRSDVEDEDAFPNPNLYC